MLLNILIHFRTAIIKNKVVITDGKIIAKTYLKSWFVLDLISSIPIGLFTSDKSVNAGFRFLRLFRRLC